MKLYCATKNPGKLREFRAAAARAGAETIVIEPIPGLEAIPAPEETDESFEANAIRKALYYGRFTPGLVFAEDSGLEVEALGGEPGVRSARYAGPSATDADNNRLLLERLAGVEQRSAKFVSVIALVAGTELLGTFRGEVEGWIAEQPRGSGGFGYDPLFYYPPLGRTFAELTPEEKLAVSHRGRALEKLIRFLMDSRSSARAGTGCS